MPKLNTEQLMERIQKRIHQLELGEEVAAKDIKALLNAEQLSVFEWFETNEPISPLRN